MGALQNLLSSSGIFGGFNLPPRGSGFMGATGGQNQFKQPAWSNGVWNGNGEWNGTGLANPNPQPPMGSRPSLGTAMPPAQTPPAPTPQAAGGSNYQDDTPFGMTGYEKLDPDAVNALGTIGIQPQGGS